MEVLLRVLLNSTKTQMSQSDSVIIQTFTHLQCSIGKIANMCRNKSMHFIYFFADKLHSVVITLVHGKENDINVSI
jgi:hypothetical protein